IYEDEARVVRDMFRWAAEGTPLREITVRLNRLPIVPKPPRGRRWAKSTVRRILTSQTYAGRAYYNRRERTSDGTRRFRPESDHIIIEVPPVVERATFECVQHQLERNQGMLRGCPPTHVYPLRGLLRGGDCGRWMKGVPAPRRRYRCSGRDRLEGDARCKAPAVSADRIERVVWETIEEGLKNPHLLMGKMREHRAGERRGIEVRTEVTQLEADLERVRARRERLLDSMMDGDLDKAIFRDKLAQLDTQERSLQEYLTRARAKL